MLEVLVLVLAQMCAAEVSLQKDTAECVGMWSINLGKVDGELDRLERQIRRYNSVFKCEDRKCDTARMRWVRELTLEAVEPSVQWSGSGSWKVARPRWLAYIDAARAFTSSERPRHPIPRATHYGGDCDNEKIGACDKVPMCWRRVRAPRSWHQAYWNSRGCKPGARVVRVVRP